MSQDDEDLSDVDPWDRVDHIGWVEKEGEEEKKKEAKEEEKVKEEDQDSLS